MRRQTFHTIVDRRCLLAAAVSLPLAPYAQAALPDWPRLCAAAAVLRDDLAPHMGHHEFIAVPEAHLRALFAALDAVEAATTHSPAAQESNDA